MMCVIVDKTLKFIGLAHFLSTVVDSFTVDII